MECCDSFYNHKSVWKFLVLVSMRQQKQTSRWSESDTGCKNSRFQGAFYDRREKFETNVANTLAEFIKPGQNMRRNINKSDYCVS